MSLDVVLTQAQFAELVGISQPAVSDLLQRNVIKTGQTGLTWLRAYTAHLREQAAGRGADGELAIARTAEARIRTERLELRLKKERGQQTDIVVLEQVLALLGAKISSGLEPLPARIKMLAPALLPEDVKAIEAIITEARNTAASASLAALLELLNADDDTDEPEAERERDDV